MYVTILTNRSDALIEFTQGLGVEVEWVERAELILQQAASASWNLVVVDAQMPALDYKKFLMDLLQINAMLNTVVVTDLDESTFHEDSEGLGVLRAVPAHPTREHGAQVANALRQVLSQGI